jgi:hypothetical protein
MKVKASKIAFIYFHLLFRIGRFQLVTGEEDKKSGLASARLSGCLKQIFSSFVLDKRPERSVGSGEHEDHSMRVRLSQENYAESPSGADEINGIVGCRSGTPARLDGIQ